MLIIGSAFVPAAAQRKKRLGIPRERTETEIQLGKNTEIQVPETSQELRVLSSVTFNRLPPYQLQV